MKHLLSVLAVFTLFIATTNAQTETTNENGASKFEVTGFVDVYFQSNFNGKTPENVSTAFTDQNNTFALGMAKLGISKELGKVSFGVDLGFGPRADVANGFSGTSFGPIQQMYVTYAPSDKVAITAGNFGTHVGYELIDANANFHYSTSYMFSYGPFYHTGVKADFAITEKLGAMVGLFNDTDNKFDDVPGKNYGAQLSYALDAGDVYLNYLGGADGVDSTNFNQIDLTASFDLSDKFALGVNATTKSTSDDRDGSAGTWYGAALYVGYAATETVSVGVRGEYLGDTDGVLFATPDLSIVDLTASANITVDALTIIPEFRIDIASENVFDNIDGEATNLSPTFILAAYYAF